MKNSTSLTSLVMALCLSTAFGPGVRAGGEQWVRSDATLDARMKEFWDAHVTWIRLYVVSALGNLPDTNNARARLFRCPTDFEAAVGPAINQIGSDQGLLSNTVMFYDLDPAKGDLLMESGSRYEVVIDFAGQRGRRPD